MKTFPEAQFYMKHDSYGGDSVMSPAAIQQLQHQLQVPQFYMKHDSCGGDTVMSPAAIQ